MGLCTLIKAALQETKCMCCMACDIEIWLFLGHVWLHLWVKPHQSACMYPRVSALLGGMFCSSDDW